MNRPNRTGLLTLSFLIGHTGDVLAQVKPVAGRALAFRTDGLARPADVSLIPFYRVHRQRYAVYWRLIDRADYDAGRRIDTGKANDD